MVNLKWTRVLRPGACLAALTSNIKVNSSLISAGASRETGVQRILDQNLGQLGAFFFEEKIQIGMKPLERDIRIF